MGDKSLVTALRSLKQKPMALALFMGFSSGLPYLLIFKTLQGWLDDEGLGLKHLGAISLVGLAYTCKFLWAPFMDRFTFSRLGRRRGWLLLTQILLLLFITALAISNPAHNLMLASVIALFIGFFGASQDIIVDAYRRESVRDEELGLASALYQFGYRVAIWITGGLAFILADQLGWPMTYMFMGSLMLVGVVTTLWADEPVQNPNAPRTMKEAVVLPLRDFFTRHTIRKALTILIFILLYKVGDSFSGNMLLPFYKSLGFTNTEIGAIAKTLGMFSTIGGAFVGGALLFRLGILRGLYIFGILQSLSTLSFAGLYYLGHSIPGFAAVIFFEDFSSGMGSAAFIAFMAALTNRNFTATQYALLTSLMAFTVRVIAAPAGIAAEFAGWPTFFTVCALMAIPGLLLVSYLSKSADMAALGTSKE